ncbi:MAG TPA: carboxypeptidase-like regulatory domain-containing protein, partial [Candidatus Sulfotelmatobacter sp.]
MLASTKKSLLAAFAVICYLGVTFSAYAQSGNSTSLTGTVTDPTGAAVVNATVNIRNSVSGFERTTGTDSSGKFTFPNVPFNPYHLTVVGQGFAPHVQDVDVRS